MAIVTSNFGEIFVRLILVVILFFAIYLLEAIITNIFLFIGNENTRILLRWLANIFFLPLNVALSWYLVAYLIALYNQAKEAANPNKVSHLKWVFIITIFGWVVIAATGFAVYKIVSTGVANDFYKQMAKSKAVNNTQKNSQENIRKLTQYEAEVLAAKTFEEINSYRKKNNLPVLEQDPRLCAYGQKRLDKFSQTGKYDSGQGFYEDVRDEKLNKVYFFDYNLTGEDVYYPLYTTLKQDKIVKFFARGGEKGLVNVKRYTHACVMADTNNLILELGEKMIRGASTKRIIKSTITPTQDYTYPPQFSR